MQLDEALSQISDIRREMAQCEVFRGCRSLTVGASGVAGLWAATLQPQWVPAPEAEFGRYLLLWCGVAALSLLVAGTEVAWRAWRAGPGLARRQSLAVVEQFLPSLVVGALVTLCIWRAAPEAAWMLPGLWGVIFGLGVFASCRLLPRPTPWIACYYVLCGCACLLWGKGELALSPWLMAITFGGGQLLTAVMLYFTLERNDAPSPTG